MGKHTPDLSNVAKIYKNLDVDTLIQHCIELDDCQLLDNGAVVAFSGKYTGRTPKDKFTVSDPACESHIWWENNNRMSPELFDSIFAKMQGYAAGKELYVVDTYGGADPNHRIKTRFIVERPYHALFIKQLLIRPTAAELETFEPDWHVLDFGKQTFDPATDGTRGDAVIALNMATKTVLIGGTQYAGEMKKSVFTIMNYLLPLDGVLSMHCSANVGKNGDTALFFGLSGTGKTTLSADPERMLIGDDEHGWTGDGVFNIEGGCYAKCIGLTREKEPEIYDAIRTGAILENVILDSNGHPDYEDSSLTENTRVAYPIDHIPNIMVPSVGGHPKNIVFLTCDALGVLPPVSRLDNEQAMFFFLNGYTAKVGGTEAGITEPKSVFSACFGAPFLPLRPKVYAKLLGEKIAAHGSKVWLINTGWTGGPYGVGSRMKLGYTRAMITAAFAGELDDVTFETDPIFGLSIPTECPGVPSDVLNPRNTWTDREAYDREATKLKAMFEANAKQFD
ncbi:MAG: phosphoenolpyruvate carboxykinase (ATP) [Armatimonadetes bacterium]|nr:phosphoenolpyruvate carboxykinase (ATP) [Armatimonadota bacterium]